MYQYGFELEGFWVKGNGVPPAGYPVDGFRGLVEFRTHGGHSLTGAWSELMADMMNHDLDGFFTGFSARMFTPDQKREIRKQGGHKEPADIRNIYGKSPRNLKGKTLASLQINISNLQSAEHTDSSGHRYSARYSLLDIPRIVMALDNAFNYQILSSGRQTGEYCVKGDRLEYRSLPCSIFPWKITEVKPFLDTIRKAVEGK